MDSRTSRHRARELEFLERLAAGPVRAADLFDCRTLADCHMTNAKQQAIGRVMETLMFRGLVRRSRTDGPGAPWVYSRIEAETATPEPIGPPPPPAPVYQPGETWSALELLAWLVQAEERPAAPGMASAFERNRGKAVAAVREIIDADTRRRKGQSA